MEKFLRVDVGSSKIYYEAVAERYQSVGGRSLIAKLLLDEVEATCEPLGQQNKLIIATGMLAGANISSAGRISIGAKSPLTGGIKESNAGGITANRLAQLGIKAIILEGLPQDDKWYMLKIDAKGANLIPADQYLGMGTYQFCETLLKEYPKAAITCIGPAGEKLYGAAGVATIDREGWPSRYSGRGGMGAVMGSKQIMAVIVDGRGNVPIADEDTFKKVWKKYTNILRDAPSSIAYRDFGTPAMVQTVNALGGLPVNNFSSGSFDQVESISAETLNDVIKQRGGQTSHACMPGCVIACSNVYKDRQGSVVVSPLEYETIGLMGSNLGIADLDVIAQLNYLCNDIGLDTIETGAAVGVAMEANVAEFGDGKAAVRLLEEIRIGTPLGRVLGNGAAVTGKVFGVINVPQVKGQAMAAYDPRAIKGMGVTYATSAMGADHTAGPTARSPVDHTNPKGHAELSYKLQKLIAILDGTGLCLFTVGAIGGELQLIVDLINSRFGWDFDLDWLNQMALQTLKDEYRFNQLAGFSKKHYRLPETFTRRKLPNLDTVFDVSEEDLDKLLEFE